MVLIGNGTPCEAALFANCNFRSEFILTKSKIGDLIGKLRNESNNVTGSIVIICANKDDAKYVTGHLTQANIKCIEFDTLFSRNQMSMYLLNVDCIYAKWELISLIQNQLDFRIDELDGTKPHFGYKSQYLDL